MKKLLFPLVLLMATTASAQMWMDVGANAGYNSTWLLNQNILDDKYTTMPLSGGGFGGVKVGINFNQAFGLALEGNYTQVNQTVSSQGLDNESWSQKTKLSYTNIPLLFRSSKKGTYVELGPQLSLLSSATESYSSTPSNAKNGSTDAKDQFQKVNFAAVFGFGAYISSITENLYITLGFRATYGLNDVVSTTGGRGQNYQPIQPANIPAKSISYAATKPLVLGFHLELDFDLVYLATAHCGRKQFLLFD